MIDIVKDTKDIVQDAGQIKRVDFEGETDLIRIIREDGYTYYIGTADRDYWDIVRVDNLPDDFMPGNYYYVGNEWLKRDIPSPSGSTENI